MNTQEEYNKILDPIIKFTNVASSEEKNKVLGEVRNYIGGWSEKNSEEVARILKTTAKNVLHLDVLAKLKLEGIPDVTKATYTQISKVFEQTVLPRSNIVLAEQDKQTLRLNENQCNSFAFFLSIESSKGSNPNFNSQKFMNACLVKQEELFAEH